MDNGSFIFQELLTITGRSKNNNRRDLGNTMIEMKSLLIGVPSGINPLNFKVLIMEAVVAADCNTKVGGFAAGMGHRT